MSNYNLFKKTRCPNTLIIYRLVISKRELDLSSQWTYEHMLPWSLISRVQAEAFTATRKLYTERKAFVHTTMPYAGFSRAI